MGVVTLANLAEVSKERPSCLVGYWLDKNGFNTPDHFGVVDLFDIEGENSDKILDLLQANTEYSFGTEVREFLASVQSHQDHHEHLESYLSTKVCLPRFQRNKRVVGRDYETTKIQRGTEKVAGTPAILSLCETQEQEKVH